MAYHYEEKKAGEALLSLAKKRPLVAEEEALKAIEVMRREEWERPN